MIRCAGAGGSVLTAGHLGPGGSWRGRLGTHALRDRALAPSIRAIEPNWAIRLGEKVLTREWMLVMRERVRAKGTALVRSRPQVVPALKSPGASTTSLPFLGPRSGESGTGLFRRELRNHEHHYIDRLSTLGAVVRGNGSFRPSGQNTVARINAWNRLALAGRFPKPGSYIAQV